MEFIRNELALILTGSAIAGLSFSAILIPVPPLGAESEAKVKAELSQMESATVPKTTAKVQRRPSQSSELSPRLDEKAEVKLEPEVVAEPKLKLETEAESKPEDTALYVATGVGAANIRGCASTDCNIIAIFADGTRVEPWGNNVNSATSSADPQWLKVSSGGFTGWVFKALLDSDRPKTQTPENSENLED